MKTKIYFRWMLTGLLLLSLCSIKAQRYQLEGKVVDKTSQEAMPFVNIVVLKNDKHIGGATTDFDGNFMVKLTQPGIYCLNLAYVGYKSLQVENIPISDSTKNKKMLIKLESTAMVFNEVEIVAYRVPLIEADQTSSGQTISFGRNGRISGSNTVVSSGVNSSDGCLHPLPGRYNPNFNTEQYDLIVENDFKKTKNDPLSTFSIDVDAASYSNCRRMIMNGNLPPADAVRIEEFINYFDYDYPQPDSKHPFSVFTEYTECPWNKAHKLIHIGIRAKDIVKENLPPNNLTFLIDVSGSMSDYNKLPLVKKSL